MPVCHTKEWSLSRQRVRWPENEITAKEYISRMVIEPGGSVAMMGVWATTGDGQDGMNVNKMDTMI